MEKYEATNDGVKRKSIIIYDKDKIQSVETLKRKIKEICQCKIESLPTMETFILHYANATHLPAETFLKIKGVESAYEDEMIVMDPDESEEIEVKKNFILKLEKGSMDRSHFGQVGFHGLIEIFLVTFLWFNLTIDQKF